MIYNDIKKWCEILLNDKNELNEYCNRKMNKNKIYKNKYLFNEKNDNRKIIYNI